MGRGKVREGEAQASAARQCVASTLRVSQLAGIKPHQLCTRHMHNMCLTTLLCSCTTWYMPRCSLPHRLLQAFNMSPVQCRSCLVQK